VNILAIDPSLTCTGLAYGNHLCETAVIKTKLKGWERIDLIMDTIRDLADTAQLVVIEGYSFGSQGRSVFQIAELGGILRWKLHRMEVPFVDVPPSTLKKYATGIGNANKDVMIAAAIRRFGFEGSDNNEADAFLMWEMAQHAYGRPPAKTNATMLDCIRKVDWP